MKKAQALNKFGKLFCISGPSGSGKTTLLATLLQDKKIAKLLSKSRSLTTRPKRTGERQGQDYFFVNKNKFENLLKAKKILESTKYLGYYYGTPKALVDKQLSQGRHLGLCLDLKGARTLKKLYPKNTVTIFVLPPSLGVLKKRIQGRCSQVKSRELAGRLRLAQKELQAAAKFDYRILNKNFNTALKSLKSIIFAHT